MSSTQPSGTGADDRLIVDTWPERIRATVARLRERTEKEPTLYNQLCLEGWLRELARIEKEEPR